MKKQISLVFALIATLAATKPVVAEPILGGQIEYTGGAVTVTVLEASAAYHNYLGLYILDGTDWVEVTRRHLGENHQTGRTRTFDPRRLGYQSGDELIFGIDVYSGGSIRYPTGPQGIFVMGPAERNPDGEIHATVDSLPDGMLIVGFEDLWGGGDRDYNDSIFSFTGGVARVPEPGVVLLIATGLIFMTVRRRRRSPAQIA